MGVFIITIMLEKSVLRSYCTRGFIKINNFTKEHIRVKCIITLMKTIKKKFWGKKISEHLTFILYSHSKKTPEHT